MMDWSKCPAVESVPGRLSGAWVFTGTRVPVSALFGNLAAGATVEEFLDWFEGVEKWQVNAVLEHMVTDLDARVKLDGIQPGEVREIPSRCETRHSATTDTSEMGA